MGYSRPYAAPGANTDITSLTLGSGNTIVPTYTFSGDTDTGISNPSANTLAFLTGGTRRITTSNGDLTVYNIDGDNYGVIHSNSDSNVILFNGGSSGSSNSGAYLKVCGVSASNGHVEIGTANGSTGTIQFYTGSNSLRAQIENNGKMSLQAGASVGVIAKVGGAIFDHYADAASTNVDGTEDNLYSDNLIASTLGNNGEKIHCFAYLNLVASATAARRVKQYFGGTLIFDSGALTLTLGGDFSIYTEIIRESATVVRAVVSVTTTSASTVPYSTYTSITGLTLSSTNIIKTTGIASGTGAAVGDITAKHGWIQWMPAA